MSTCQCDECRKSFDSEFDPKCFVNATPDDVGPILCAACRDAENEIIAETISYSGGTWA